jgi:hypothetical protein
MPSHAFRLHRLAEGAAFDGGLHSVPGERRAFDADRVGLDAGQRLEPVGVLLERLGKIGRLAARHLGVEGAKKLVRLLDRLALQHLGHERGRRRRDGAAAPLEHDVLDAVAVELQVDRHLVAAERVVAVREMARVIELAEIPRVAAVIEDDVLVELAQIHHANILCAARSASASASMSLSSL